MKAFTLNNKADTAKDLFVEVPIAQAIHNSVVFLLSVNKGERPILKDFGSELYKFLFRRINLNLKNSIISHVKFILNKWIDKISNVDVSVKEDTVNQLGLIISISYTIINTKEKQILNIPIKI